MKGKQKRKFHRLATIGLMLTLTASFGVAALQTTTFNDAVMSAFAAESATDEIKFEFDEKEKILTVGEENLSGDPIAVENQIEMENFTDEKIAPWSAFASTAKVIVVSDGIKNIGDNAFVSFSDIEEVTVPESVATISDKAFVDCKKDFIIKSVKGSAAEEFAEKNQIKFEEIKQSDNVSSSDLPTTSTTTTTATVVSASDVTTTTVASPSDITTTTTTVATTTTTAKPVDPTIPVNVTVKSADYNKLKISWNKVEGAAGYYLYYSSSSKGKYSIVKYINDGKATSYTHGSRTYGKTYYYKIKSYRIVDGKRVFSPYSNVVSGKTYVAPPSDVQNVKIATAAYNKLKISWDKVSDAQGYYLYYAEAVDGKYKLAKNITKNSTTSYIHSSRTYEKTYYYKVRPYKKAGSKVIYGDYSDVISGKTHIEPPAPVQNVKVTYTAYNKLTISWDKVDDAECYYVYCATSPDGKYTIAYNIRKNTTTSYVHSNRKLGQTYYYKVRSYNRIGSKALCADYSETVSGKTYLHVPSNLQISTKSDSTLYITWDKVKSAAKYYIYRSIDGGDFNYYSTAYSANYKDRSVIPGKTYSYKVCAVRGSYKTACSDVASCEPVLAAPAMSKATDAGSTSVKIQWKKVSGASGYHIYTSTEADGEYKKIGAVSARYTTYTANKLTTGTRYYFKVKAYKTVNKENGYSDLGSYKYATPTLPATRKISVSSLGTAATFVEWNTVSGANGYEIYGGKYKGELTLITTVKTNYYAHKGLDSNQKYSYKVRAYKVVNGKTVYGKFSSVKTEATAKYLSKSKYAWSYSHNVKNHKTPSSLLKQQEMASATKTILKGDSSRKVIYLTMDCGYPSKNSDKNLDTLKEKNVHATFFIAMPYAKGSKKQIQRMIDEGHTLGNHTKSHIRLNKASASTIKSEVKAVEDYIYENFNYKTKYFRYPHGAFSYHSQNELLKMGYTSVGWSFAYDDFTKEPNKNYAYKRVTENIFPGSILLLHMDSDTNTAILADFIDEARALGYEFGSLDDIEI